MERSGRYVWRIGDRAFSARTLIRANFTLAVAVTILVGIMLVAGAWPDGAITRPAGTGGSRGAGAVRLGLQMILGETLLWWWRFRADTNDNAMPATVFGALLLLPVAESLISDAVNGPRAVFTAWHGVFIYLAVSHVAYGVYCWISGRRSLLDP